MKYIFVLEWTGIRKSLFSSWFCLYLILMLFF